MVMVGLFVLAGLVIGAVAGFLVRSARPVRQSGTLSHSVYVWQRFHGDNVVDALRQAAPCTAGFTVLAAEVAWTSSGEPQVFRVSPDYAALKQTGRPVGFALRVGPYSGSFDPQDQACRLLCGLAVETISKTRQHGLEPAEMQIDFDCPESKLDSYRRWVEAMKREVAPVKLTITTLPCWLNQSSFARLVRSTDGFVLQVHSLERPAGVDADLVLCDPRSAADWVEQAARLGVPFRVALPTYGYLVAFGTDGQFVGLNAEGPSQSWPQGVTIRALRADPFEMAGLLKSWERSRPLTMEGVIWYRLPVKGDRLNWRWVTLSTVMSGTTPRRGLHAGVNYPQTGLAEVYLVNDGQMDESPDVSIHLEWDARGLLGADGLNGFSRTQTNPTSIRLERAGPEDPRMIAPGEKWMVGWLRFDGRKEVRSHVSRLGS